MSLCTREQWPEQLGILAPLTQEAAFPSLDKDIQQAAAAVLWAEDNLSLVRKGCDGVIGVPKSTPPAQVIELLMAEAVRGYAQAQCLLGIMYERRSGCGERERERE